MKEIYYIIIIGILLVGFVVMSLILIQGLLYVKEISESFINYIEELLPWEEKVKLRM